MDYIVKDPSLYAPSGDIALVGHRYHGVFEGTIVSCLEASELNNDHRYVVSISMDGGAVEIPCQMSKRFGGVHNYEETIPRGYQRDDDDQQINFRIKAGDRVIVACLNGSEGIILTMAHHTARKSELSITDGPQTKWRFNGFETHINPQGEMTWTFRGLPTNTDALNQSPSGDLPEAEFDEEVGGSNFKFMEDGSIRMADTEEADDQIFLIDKTNKLIQIKSGDHVFTIDQQNDKVELTTKSTEIASDDKFTLDTREFLVAGGLKIELKAPKVYLGSASVEVVDQIMQLIDAIGTIALANAAGATNPVSASPAAPLLQKIKASLATIKS